VDHRGASGSPSPEIAGQHQNLQLAQRRLPDPAIEPDKNFLIPVQRLTPHGPPEKEAGGRHRVQAPGQNEAVIVKTFFGALKQI
jgi:hypothetical protein